MNKREMKFRVFNNNFNKWFYYSIPEDIGDKNDDGVFLITFDEGNDWEKKGEYIGLKDKKSQEIYEGDLVKFHTDYERESDNYSGITQVMWIEKEAGFYPFTLNNRWRCDVKDVEVIGNIYENPELLKEEE